MLISELILPALTFILGGVSIYLGARDSRIQLKIEAIENAKQDLTKFRNQTTTAQELAEKIEALLAESTKTKITPELASTFELTISYLESDRCSSFSAEDSHRLHLLIGANKTDETDDIERKFLETQAGFISKNFLIYVVPGFIAIVVVGLYAYLRIINADVENYQTPEDLNSLMTVIVGYLFGAGAASA